MPEDRSRRQIARTQQRLAGDRSAKLASELMKLADTKLAKLDLDDDLRAVIEDARRITAQNARRRAERTLAGELRRWDLAEIAAQLAPATEPAADSRRFHLAEQWRTKLIEQGMSATAELPELAEDAALPGLVENAQHERATGQARGAAKLLFRHLMKVLP